MATAVSLKSNRQMKRWPARSKSKQVCCHCQKAGRALLEFENTRNLLLWIHPECLKKITA